MTSPGAKNETDYVTVVEKISAGASHGCELPGL